MKQLERFEADPFAYQPEGDSSEALVMSNELVLDYRAHKLRQGRSAKYVREACQRLADWMEALGGTDLRRVTLRDHIRPALDRWGVGLQHRIIALKAFYAWLRTEKALLTSAQDPTLDLPVPQASPEKYRRRKAVAWEYVAAVYRRLSGPYRDVLQVLAGTGWHVTELERLVRDADSAILAPASPTFDRQGRPVLGVLVVRHKTGKQTRTGIAEADVLEAAKRLKARGEMPRRLNETIAAACSIVEDEDAAADPGHKRRPPFTAGVLRHSYATWALEAGATPEETAQALGHESARTTLRFYADVAVPVPPVAVRALR